VAMPISTLRLMRLLRSYLWDFRGIHVLIILVTLCLAGLLYFAEGRLDPAVPPGGPRSGAAEAARVVAGGGAVYVVAPSREFEPSRQELLEIRRELQQVFSALSRLDQDLAGGLARTAERLRAVDDELRSLVEHWRRVDESRRVTPMRALYYTCIAMLGLGDFGARTDCGRTLVVVAGFWGVLVFGLVTALLVAAVMKQYERARFD
jgi:hypothetical protein